MIRPANLNDVDQMAALVRASFDPQLHDFMIYAQHGIGRFMAVHMNTPMPEPIRRFLVATDESGRVQAFAEFQNGTENGVAFLSYICVSAKARGRGIATALIDDFLAASRSRALQLDVFAENRAALALYKKLGFETAGTTAWFVRDLPVPRQTAALRLINAVEATAMHAHYGFCRHVVDWNGSETFIGRIGPRTLRCFRPEDFGDTRLLAAARALYPGTQHALFICATDAANRPDDAMLFHTSLRLVRNTRSSREG